MLNIFRNKIHLFRTYRFKLIVSKVLYLYKLFSGKVNSSGEPSFDIVDADAKNGLKIGIIDHSYHQKTKSTSFFTDLLRSHFTQEIFWDEKWNGGKPVNWQYLSSRELDSLIIWQIFYYHKPVHIEKSGFRSIFVIPMYDDSFNLPDHILRRYKKFNFISFSKHYHERLKGLDLNSRYFQFFTDPSSIAYDLALCAKLPRSVKSKGFKLLISYKRPFLP